METIVYLYKLYFLLTSLLHPFATLLKCLHTRMTLQQMIIKISCSFTESWTFRLAMRATEIGPFWRDDVCDFLFERIAWAGWGTGWWTHFCLFWGSYALGYFCLFWMWLGCDCKSVLGGNCEIRWVGGSVLSLKKGILSIVEFQAL